VKLEDWSQTQAGGTGWISGSLLGYILDILREKNFLFRGAG
jgi:hypothetical protein